MTTRVRGCTVLRRRDQEEESHDRSARWALLLVGTRKGLWIGTSDEGREDWTFTGPHFDMEEVYSCLIDTRGETPRLLVGASSSWLGPQVWRSDDLGAHWQETANGAMRFPEDTGATLERVWQLVLGRRGPDVVYAGTEPAAVWRSDDRGETFALERGAVGPPAPDRLGRRLRRPGLPHPAAAPDRPAVGDRGAVVGRRLPDQRRRASPGSRATTASAPTSCPRVSSTPSSASASTR